MTTVISLNDACYCYAYVVNGLASGGRGIQASLRESAENCAEELRRAICEQFNLPSDTTWETILTDAGVSQGAPDQHDRCVKSIRQTLDDDTAALMRKLEELRFKITGEA